MTFRLALLSLLISGCASTFATVPSSDWQSVPATQRTAVDRQSDKDFADARAELAASTTALANARRATAPARHATVGASSKLDPSADDWAAAVHDHEQTRLAAIADVESAKQLWQRANLTYRQLRLEAANARIAVVVSDREYQRARTIDHNLLGTDTYETATYRGQLARAQELWYSVSASANQARDAFELASAKLASAKEAYAQLMRNGPVKSTIAAVDKAARMQLTGWSVNPTELGHRKGLHYVLDDDKTISVHVHVGRPALHGMTSWHTANR